MAHFHRYIYIYIYIYGHVPFKPFKQNYMEVVRAIRKPHRILYKNSKNDKNCFWGGILGLLGVGIKFWKNQIFDFFLGWGTKITDLRVPPDFAQKCIFSNKTNLAICFRWITAPCHRCLRWHGDGPYVNHFLKQLLLNCYIMF